MSKSCRSVESFQKINRIGEGTYGFVYRAVHLETKEVVALKRIIMHNEDYDGFPLTSLREIKLLKRCNHINIVRLYDVVVGSKRDAVFLMFEYCEHDLATLMSKVKKTFKESEVKCLTEQLLSAVEYIHRNWIIHRDIKLSNLLYNSKGQLKLADFGLARSFSKPAPGKITQKVVTLWYRAPELLLGCDTYSFPVDVWSVGCILGELLLNRPLIAGDDEADQIKLIFTLLGCPNARIWPAVHNMPLVVSGAVNLLRDQDRYQYNNMRDVFPSLGAAGLDLLHGLLAYDPALRLSARSALQHDYFHCSPYPQDPELMPTFPTLHDDMMASELADRHTTRANTGVNAITGVGQKRQRL